MSARIASSQADHRRGIVLGLTMAEVLILLLFVLMLALTSALAVRDRAIHVLNGTAAEAQKQADQARRELEAVRPVLAALSSTSALPEKVAVDLARHLAASDSQRHELERLRQQTEGLGSRLSAAEGQLREWHDLAADAHRLDPQSPPSMTLKRALKQSSVSSQPQLSDFQARSGQLRRLEDIARGIDPAVPPAATMQRALDRMAQGGTVTDVVVAVRDAERRLADRLQQEFGRDLARWNASLDPSSLTLRFANPELLFEAGSASLRQSFEAVLSDFFPRYIARLGEFRDDIDEVRIEGHTSSEWRGASSQLDAYFRNMALSQDRTRAALEFGMNRTTMTPETRDWARGLVTANGLASSRLRSRADGTEDREGSRRVEFRVLMKLRENVMRVVDGQR